MIFFFGKLNRDVEHGNARLDAQQDISELDMTEVQFSFLRRPFIQNMIPTDKVSQELKDIPYH